MSTNGHDFLEPVLERIASRAGANELHARWPADDLSDLAEVGAMRWAIGKEFGGEGLSPLELHDRYELIATASLATALVLSQRDAAIGFIDASDNTRLKSDLLTRLARNEVWTTIGISHLTTSFHSGTLIAREVAGGYMLRGTIPWATGGAHSAFIIAGAKMEDGRQLVFVLPTHAPGVTVHPPLKLATLSAAPTSAIDCVDVLIEPDRIVAGPALKALARRSNGLPIGQAFAALGLARAALQLIEKLPQPSAATTYDSLKLQLDELSRSVRDANTHLAEDQDLQSGPLIRSECNNLALRAAHAAVALYKGAALRIDHPAQRLAREAMFLLVWSSPASVTDRNLELISEPH